MKNKLLQWVMLPCLFFFGNIVYGQTVTGVVSDELGPLPGVNIQIKDTTTGTQTDFDGNYTLNNVSSDDVIIFSYLGYKTQEIQVDDQTVINVVMEKDENTLQEVVVVGYGSQTRGDLTGSVASVDIAESVKTPVVNAAELLDGRVSGVAVKNTGQPGSAPKITIRGFGTSNNTDPLYIIDGVQTTDGNLLNNINPADIEQINVLKDGAAAIYGARASNGVIIVTTKSGGYSMTKPSLNVEFYTGSTNAVNLPDLMNPQQHGEMIFESLRNDGSSVEHPQYGSGASPEVPSQLLGVPVNATVRPGGTNWLEAITRTGTTQNASVSFQNGNDTGKYFMSANYLNRDGILEYTGYQRGSTRLNSEFRINDNIRVGEHLTASFSNTTNPGRGAQINEALRSSPLIPTYDDDGNLAGTYTASAGLGNSRSPLAQLFRGRNNYNKSLRVFGDIYLEADILDGLTFKSQISASVEAFDSESFQALDPEHSEPISTNTLRVGDNNNYTWTWTNTLNYKKSFGDHNFNVLLGVEALENINRGKGISRTGFLFETPDFYLLSNGSGNTITDFAFKEESSLFSLFGNVNYNYQGKYLATITVRNDKSSRFVGDNKSDTFISYSGGWVISKEDFFPEDGIINNLKIKGSYGELGNQTLPANNPTINISSLNENLADYSFDGTSISTGALLSQVGNPDLRWETSISKNIGVNMSMFDSALNFSLEYFDIETTDLVTRDNSLISTTAIDAQAPLVNLGDVKNTGFDLSIGYQNQTDSGFSYGINANVSRYKNEVTNLISDFQSGRTDLRGGAVTRTQVGEPISSFYGRVVEGVFASEAEVSAAADQGFASDADGVGRFKYKDLNGDGVINDDDRTIIGSPHPDFTFGVNLTAAYKGFDFSAFFTGSVGNQVYNYEKIFTDFPTFFNGNRSTRLLNSFSESNPNSNIPALSQTITNNETAPNSFFVEDADFVRLKNIQIGYTLPSSFSDKFGMDSFRVYLQGSNILTITDYDGFDPEVISNDNLSLGIDFNTFPIAEVYTLGVNIKF